MKKGTTLLMALGLMMATSVSAQAETEVNDYVVDFNEAISTSNHNFKVADGWGHIVDYYAYIDPEDSWYNQDYYVTYNHYSSDGTLYINTQYVGPSWAAPKWVYDMLVTPKVSGEVTFKVKLGSTSSNSFIEFYNINDDNTRGEIIGSRYNTDSDPALNNSDFTTITLTFDEPTAIGIRGSLVYIDEFHAAKAYIEPNKLMTVTSAKSHCSTTDGNDSSAGVIYWAEDPTHKTADNKNMVKICYMVTVKNACNVTLTQGEPNYSVSIINSKVDDALVTVPVPQTLAPGETSEPFEVTAYVDPSKIWSYAGATSERFNIRENLDGTVLERAGSGYKAYAHAYVFRTLNATTTGKFTSPISFGMISEEATQNFEIYNNGVAPLTVTSISVDAPFTVAHSDNLTINNQEKITVDVTFPDNNKGTYSGNLTIKYTDNDGSEATVTYEVNGTMLDANTWSTAFGEGKSSDIVWPEGSVAEGSVDGSYTYVGGDNPYNTYAKVTSSSTGNKFFTPLLHASAGDTMSFMVKAYSTSSPSVKVYVTTDRTQLGEPTLTITDMTTSAWALNTLTISEEGDYYIGFELYNAYLDDIVGLTKVDVAHDLYIRDLGSYSSTSYQSGETISKEINVIPVLAAKADDYTVEFMLGDEVAATVDSQDLTAHAKTATRFSASATKTVTATTNIDYYWRFTFKNDGPVFESEHVPLTIICEPKFCFVKPNAHGSASYAPDNQTKYSFGKVNEQNLTANYEIFNWGKAPLTVNSITLPTGFSTNFTAPVSLASKEFAEVDIIFSASELGTYEGNVVINFVNAKGENEDFEFAVSGTLLDSSKFYAPFMSNSDSDYPAGSVRDSNVSINYKSGASGDYALYGSGSGKNFFITPKLHANAGESFTFDARLYNTSASWSDGAVSVYASVTREGLRDETTRTLLAELKGKDVEDEANLIPGDAFKTFTATIAEAGNYYIGYEITKGTYVDEIYGLSLVDVAHDIELVGFTAPETAMQNNLASATVQLRNFGFEAEAAGSYSAIVSVNGVETEVTDLPEIKAMLKSNDSPVSISVPFRYGKVGTYPVSVKLQFGDYIVETEPADVEFTEEVFSPEKTVGVFSGNATVPFNTAYNKSETIALYTPDKLGLNGGEVINTIVIKGYNTGTAWQTNVRICYAWVDDTTINPSGDIDESGMTEVINEEYSWPLVGSSSERVDVITMNLNGAVYPTGKSLLIFFHSDWNTWKSATQFESSKTEGINCCYFRQHDTSLPTSWDVKNLPVLHITLAVEPKTISGTVTGPDNQPVAGATVTLTATDGSGVEYTGTTADDGTYEITVIQANRTYNVIAEANGLEATAEDVTFAESVTRNFKLGVPVVHIHPEATGVKSAENVNVRFNLDLTTGYHALALPFAVTADMVATLFGADAEIYTLTGTELADGALMSYFDTATSVEAGEPFLVHVTETIDEVIEGVTIVAEPKIGGAASGHVTFSADYKPTSAAGKFMFDDAGFTTLPAAQAARFGRAKAQAEDIVPAFHATVQARPNQQINSMNFAVNQTPTGINEISVKSPEGKAYNLRGMRSLNPTKGIYIINGKKVLVK